MKYYLNLVHDITIFFINETLYETCENQNVKYLFHKVIKTLLYHHLFIRIIVCTYNIISNAYTYYIIRREQFKYVYEYRRNNTYIVIK